MNEVVVDTRKDTAVRGVVRHALGTLSETGYTDRFRVEGREKLLYSYVLTDKGIDAHGILMAVLAMPPLVVRKVDSDGGGSLRTDGLTGILQRN
ncbi:MAG: hypothetical protein HYS81_03350 [Candidatus Aenigmatarchaeota archaeon]|nr:MAG: hypothetical protein HYS81_03350 [Candidatus Aenigmarchaeota archaeon]